MYINIIKINYFFWGEKYIYLYTIIYNYLKYIKMGDYVPLVTEGIIFCMYMTIFFIIWLAFISWSVEQEKQGEVWKWASIVSAILAVLTTWGMLAASPR